MKKNLLILSLGFFGACGLFTENHRDFKYKTVDGKEIKLNIHEEKHPLSEKILVVYGNDYPLKGMDCEDAALKNFTDEMWGKIAKQNDLAEIKSGTIHLLKRQKEAMPENCNYVYKRQENGEWIRY